jgi:uncharacterized protein YhfF
MPEPSKEYQQFWQNFLKTQSDPEFVNERFYESFHFSSTQELANELAGLVLDGTKTATSTLIWENEAENKPLVLPGLYSIVTDWDGRPVCVIETTEVRIKPFKEIDAEFAHDYGEEARTLEWWKEAMWQSYSRICAGLNKTPSPDMLLICERFKVVYPERNQAGSIF